MAELAFQWAESAFCLGHAAGLGRSSPSPWDKESYEFPKTRCEGRYRCHRLYPTDEIITNFGIPIATWDKDSWFPRLDARVESMSHHSSSH